MSKEEINRRITEIKSDYIRLQEDIDKMAAYGRDTSPTEKVLSQLELDLARLRKQLEAL